MNDFTTPAFLENRSTADFFNKIKEILPADLDLSEGSHSFNYTFPTAIVASEICQFIAPEIIKLIFPQWSYGEFLRNHAKGCGIIPKEATAATGELTITGAANTIIPAGSLFSVPSINDEPSVDYATLEAVTIPSSGSVTVNIECTQTGIVGNTPANTIVLVSSKLTGITSVINEEEITGGAEAESDKSLLERIEEYEHSQGESFIGNDADYKRWAKEAGAGDATVKGAEDDSGVVTLIITDENGAPANTALITKVYNHIMRPDNREERLAPCGAILNIVAPATIDISIKATVELTDDASIEAVKSKFLSLLASYLPEALDEGEVKHTRIAAILTSVEWVNDFKDLQIGIKTDSGVTFGTENIPISDLQLPTVDANDLLLTSGTV